MLRDSEPPVSIGVIHPSKLIADIVEYIAEEEHIRLAGHLSYSPPTPESFQQFLRRYNPDILVVSVPYPYQESWANAFYLMSLEESEGKAFLVTTTSMKAAKMWAGTKQLEKWTQRTASLAIIEEPFELSGMVKALQNSSRSLIVKDNSLEQGMAPNDLMSA